MKLRYRYSIPGRFKNEKAIWVSLYENLGGPRMVPYVGTERVLLGYKYIPGKLVYPPLIHINFNSEYADGKFYYCNQLGLRIYALDGPLKSLDDLIYKFPTEENGYVCSPHEFDDLADHSLDKVCNTINTAWYQTVNGSNEWYHTLSKNEDGTFKTTEEMTKIVKKLTSHYSKNTLRLHLDYIVEQNFGYRGFEHTELLHE